VKRFLAITRIWILAIPFLLSFAGAASNQLVLAVNHDKFPVMFNQYKTVQYEMELEIKIAEELHVKNFHAAINDQLALGALQHGYLDETHVLMTDKTHLNFLADWIDLHSAIYSPGDLLLETGDYLQDWAGIVWGAVLAIALFKRDKE
jgi:hypothetical protein